MAAIRRKLPWALVAALGLLLVAALAGVVRGGPLDPPAPPGSTLPQVEPRIPISSLPFTISQPGSYFLTRNLAASGGSGITVSANDVTIDLNGFALDGGAGGTDAITDGGSSYANISVRNGTIRAWADDGIDLQASNNVRIAAITADGNQGSGIEMGSGRVSDCIVGGPLTGTVALRAMGSADVADCTTTGYGTGISLNGGGSVRDCLVEQPGIVGIYSGPHVSITRCHIRDLNPLASAALAMAIFVDGGYARIEDNFIEHSTISLYGQAFGVRGNGPFNVIRGNVLQEPGQCGVALDGANGATVVDNTGVSLGEGCFNVNIGTNLHFGPGGAADTSTNPWANLSP